MEELVRGELIVVLPTAVAYNQATGSLDGVGCSSWMVEELQGCISRVEGRDLESEVSPKYPA